MAPDLTVRDLLVKENYCPVYSGPRMAMYDGYWYTAWSSPDYLSLQIARAHPSDLETWTVVSSTALESMGAAASLSLDVHGSSLYILSQCIPPGEWRATWLWRYDIPTDVWHEPEWVGGSSFSSNQSYHARVHEGILYMLWMDTQLRYSEKVLPDGVPTAGSTISSGRTASLAILPDDTILVAYDSYSAGVYRVKVLRRDGASWVEELSVSGGYSRINANLETGEAWLGTVGAVVGPRVFARMRSAAGVWGDVEYVTEDYDGDTEMGNFRGPVFAFDKAGVVYCAFTNYTANNATRRPVMCYKHEGIWLPTGKYNEIDLGDEVPPFPYVSMVPPWEPLDVGAMFLWSAAVNGNQRLAVISMEPPDIIPEEKPIWRTARVMNAGRHPRNMGREVRSGINE